jgi:hypothetical protein
MMSVWSGGDGLVCGMKRGIFERDHAVSMFPAKDRHQQSAVGGFDQEGPNVAGFVA